MPVICPVITPIHIAIGAFVSKLSGSLSFSLISDKHRAAQIKQTSSGGVQKKVKC